MPQVWNPSISTDQDSGGFSKNSRYMKLSNFSEASLRRIKVRNSLESNLNRIQQAYITRHTNHSTLRLQQTRKNLIDKYRRFMAHKLVLKNHRIQEREDYQAALNDNYSLHALRHEIRRMIRDIDPNSVRQRKAESLVQQSKDKYLETVRKNSEAIGDLVPKPKPDYLVEDEEEEPRSPTPPPAPPILRRSIVGPPMRGLANKAQAVTLQMVKEKSWLSAAPSPSEKALSNKNLNPHAVLPAIKA